MDPARSLDVVDALGDVDRRLRALERVDDAFTAYAPLLTQTVTVASTVVYARHTRAGRLIHTQAYLNAAASGTANSPIRVALPVVAAEAGLPCGHIYWYDASAGVNFVVPAWLATTGTAGGLLNGSASQLGQTATVGGITYPNQVAAGDSILIDIRYEAAV